MSIIEQAARRLEELRRSGIAVGPPGSAARAEPQFNGHPIREGAVAAPPSIATLPTTGSRTVEIDVARLEANGFVAPNAARNQVADEFRAIKRPLVANIRGESAAPIRRANCIMITSARPAEGKTFTAINLALSLAMEVDSRVLLIDADVIRPMVLERLGLPESKGLLDKLVDPELALADLILRTNIDKFSLLPAGQSSARATELLASDAMRRVVEELATRYSDRIVIFDTPPLLAAPETRVLASHVGQIIVVVEAGSTPQRALLEALGMLESCPVVMTMLNKATGVRKPVYGDGYGGYA